MALSQVQNIAPATQSTFLQNYLSQIGPNLALGGLQALLPFVAGDSQEVGREIAQNAPTVGATPAEDMANGLVPEGGLSDVYKWLIEDYDRRPTGGLWNLAGTLMQGAGRFIPGINPIGWIKTADTLINMIDQEPNAFTTNLTGATKDRINELLTPVLNEMGDPLPMSEGFSHGAVQGELMGEDGSQTLSRWLDRSGNPVYDMSFLMKSELPVASNPSDLGALLFDTYLKKKGTTLAPDTNLMLEATVNPERQALDWMARLGDGGAGDLKADDLGQLLPLLYGSLESGNMLVPRG